MWWRVLLAVLGALAALSCCRIKICIGYSGALTARLKILFLGFTLYPKKEKIKLEKFTARGVNKQVKKLKGKEKKQQGQKVGEDKAENMLGAVRSAGGMIAALRDKFLDYLTVEVAQLHLCVASEDAARTAILYGVAVQGVQYIITLLDEMTNFRAENDMSISVFPDFTSEKPYFHLNITLSVRIWQALSLALRAAAFYIKDSKNKNSAS